jgi:hypothetical protein
VISQTCVDASALSSLLPLLDRGTLTPSALAGLTSLHRDNLVDSTTSLPWLLPSGPCLEEPTGGTFIYIDTVSCYQDPPVVLLVNTISLSDGLDSAANPNNMTADQIMKALPVTCTTNDGV